MRKEKALKNFLTSIIPYVVLIFLGFIRVDFFIDNLGDEIYALNQLFYQIFIYISLAEAGAGTYITQMYYKLFVNNDKKEIVNTYNAAKRMLKKIALIVVVVGVCVSFFLTYLTNNTLSLTYMQFVFVLFLLKNVVEYLMLAPKAVIEADQKLYKVNVRYYIMKIFEVIVDIVLLKFGVNYVYILLGEIMTKFLTYFVTNKRIFKEYPWLKEKPTEVKTIKGVSNILWHRISEAIHYNTDIIITSSFLTPILVTIYSSYNYITKYLSDGVDMVGAAMTPSLGNVIYKEKKEDVISIFEETNIFFLFIASFITIMTYALANSFVSNIWLGEKYLIGNWALIILCINLFITIARKPLNMFRNSNGLFKETKVIVMFEAIVNLALSIALVSKFKLTGILFATMVSMLVTTWWYMPYFIYNKKLDNNCLKYFLRYVIIFGVTVILSVLSLDIVNIIGANNIIKWLICACLLGIVNLVIISLILYILYNEFKRLIGKLLMIIRRKK